MKKTLLITLMVAMAATVMAQTQVQNAFESLKQSGFTRTQRTNHTSDNGKRTGLLEIYSFTTSTSADRRVVERLINALASESEEAYSYVSHQASDKPQRYAVYYDSKNSEVIGRDKDDNYVLFNVMDPDDETNTYRYCYALEWRTNDDGNLKGRALMTYAPKPSSSRQPFAWRSGERQLGSIDIPQGNGKSYTLDLDSIARATGLDRLLGDSVMVSVRTLGLDSLGSALGDALKGLKGLKGLEGLESLGSLDGLEELKDRIIVLSNDDKDEPADDVEWLTSFNHYRNAFKRAAAKESSTMASYATSILKLCKNAKKVHLSDGELNLCRKSIKEMQKMTKDSFVKGLLDEAITNLR